jgi:hypothetical protein
MGAMKLGLQTALSSGKLANILAGAGDIAKELSGKLPQGEEKGTEKGWFNRKEEEAAAAAAAAEAAAAEAKKKQTTMYIIIGAVAFVLLFGKKLMK